MFTPNQQDVRRFFCTVHRKHLAGEVLTPIEAQAATWVAEHPEYHADLADEAAALARTYDGSDGRENPFLHLAMHLSVTEQTQGGTRQTAQSIRELALLAQELKDSVSRFRVAA